MKTVKKSSYTKTTIVLLVIIAILSVALIAVALIAFWPKSSDDFPAETTIPTFTIETPYCVLQYPEQWKEQMTVKESAVDKCVAETFYAIIAGNQYELFTIYFGNSTAGELFGYLTNDGNKIPVYIECHKMPQEHSLTESELSLFYAMMEGVNEVAQSISFDDGYSES